MHSNAFLHQSIWSPCSLVINLCSTSYKHYQRYERRQQTGMDIWEPCPFLPFTRNFEISWYPYHIHNSWSADNGCWHIPINNGMSTTLHLLRNGRVLANPDPLFNTHNSWSADNGCWCISNKQWYGYNLACTKKWQGVSYSQKFSSKSTFPPIELPNLCVPNTE